MTDMNQNEKKIKKGFNPAARRKSRRLLVQALYQWQMTGQEIHVVESQFLVQTDLTTQGDIAYFREVLRAILTQIEQLDAHMASFLDRKVADLDPIELAVLRLGTYELAQRLDIPYRVAVNESLELAKIFGSPDSYKYVNGILDKVAKQLRTVEIQAERS
jgi:transcription antitermination protein NusB